MSAWAIANLLLGAPAAHAQEPIRMCADAAAGAEIEVCVRLAADHPSEVEGIAAALRAHADRSSADDRDLLEGLLLLLNPATAHQGAALLGALHDPRSVVPLTSALRHAPIAAAAAGALAQSEQGLLPLAEALGDASLPIPTRVAAAQALGLRGTPNAGDALLSALRRRDLPPPVRSAAIDTLVDHFPERAGELDTSAQRPGNAWVIGATSLSGGLTLGLAGAVGARDLSAVGAGAGLATGAAGGWLITRARPTEAGEAARFATSGAMGAVGGAALVAGLAPHRAAAPWAGAVGGQLVGYGLASVAGAGRPAEVGDALEASALAGLSGVIVASTWPDHPRVVPASGGAVLAGLAVGQAVAPAVRLDGADGWMISLAAAYGGAFGALVPLGGRARGPLPVAGVAAGAIAGYALAAPLKARNDVVFGAALGMAYGGAAGWGVGRLVAPTDREVARVGALAGGSVGLVSGAVFAWRDLQAIDSPDTALVSAVTGWAAAQALALHARKPERPHSEARAVLVPAVLGGVTAVSTTWVEVPEGYTFAGTSLGVLGAWTGGATTELVGGDPLIGVVIGANAGIITGIALAAPPVSAPPLVLALGDAGAVLGGAVGGLGVAWFTTARDPILAGALLGTGLGFGAGVWTGARLHRSGATREVAWHRAPELPGTWALLPAALPGAEGVAMGLAIEGRGW